jgi:hypothetical protein
MNPSVRAFRNILAHLCQKKGVKFRKILDDFDVDEALEQAENAKLGSRESWPPLSCGSAAARMEVGTIAPSSSWRS